MHPKIFSNFVNGVIKELKITVYHSILGDVSMIEDPILVAVQNYTKTSEHL